MRKPAKTPMTSSAALQAAAPKGERSQWKKFQEDGRFFQEGPLAGYVSTLVKIQAAFEHAGIQFIDDDELGGFGVRMAKKKRKR